MTIHIISDNQFFLIGITEKINEEYPFSDIKTCLIHDFYLFKDGILRTDTVIIFLYNKATRMKILCSLVNMTDNIVIMVDSFFEHGITSSYPQRICSRSTFQQIMGLQEQQYLQPSPGNVSEKTYRLFKELYNGTSINAVVENLNINLFNIYNLKKRVFDRFGLKNINDKGILHCMEYLEMSRLVNTTDHS